ncbi:MAG: hypothetical protein ACUVTP_11555 [Candidatus Fervidibacter sp.]|uniref:hypothetical protein n=1 Tax=Candidatus Fervidibacter sp. TaxID=3100871 RepID=UPI00404A357F
MGDTLESASIVLGLPKNQAKGLGKALLFLGLRTEADFACHQNYRSLIALFAVGCPLHCERVFPNGSFQPCQRFKVIKDGLVRLSLRVEGEVM